MLANFRHRFREKAVSLDLLWVGDLLRGPLEGFHSGHFLQVLPRVFFPKRLYLWVSSRQVRWFQASDRLHLHQHLEVHPRL